MRVLSLFLFVQGTLSLKFCANEILPSGFCPENAVDICQASTGAFCIKAGLQYKIGNTNGCEKFEAGTLSGNCFQIGNEDVEGDTSAPTCNPHHRTYCECSVCTTDTDCGTIAGYPSSCIGEPTGSGDAYADGFEAGRYCGQEDCMKALREAYANVGDCENVRL